jgi:hypothetical protein
MYQYGHGGFRLEKSVYEIDGRHFSTLEEFYDVVGRG